MVKKQRTLPQKFEESFTGMIIEEIGEDKEKEPEINYGEGYAPDIASPETFQWIEDAGKEIFDIFGMEPYMIKDFNVYNSQKKRHWDRLAPDEELGNYLSTDVAQAVMEGQEDRYDIEDIYIWINDKSTIYHVFLFQSCKVSFSTCVVGSGRSRIGRSSVTLSA